LRLETGRYEKCGDEGGNVKTKLDREQRKCLFCNLDRVENELHFLFECPLCIKERCLFVNEIQILCSNFPYLNNSDKLYWLFNIEEPKIYMAISTFYKQVLKQERQSIVKTNPSHLLQFRWYFNIQCKKYCNYMTVMTLSLSLLFIYVKFYLYLDSFCLLCNTICMPQVGPNWK
jgi:hypothetical protein